MISSGQLIHKEIEIEGLGFIWEVESYVNDQLDTNKAYYMSIKANKTALSAIWYISETPMKAESEQGYYHFNVGVLYNVLDGRRDYSFTNGMTTINGDTITSGKISADRLDVDELFAKSITATNFQLETGRVGDFWIEDGKIIPFKGEFGYDFYNMLELRTDGYTFDSMNRFRADFSDILQE